jgi:hypothetical protein
MGKQKQEDLPGMEERKIPDLHKAATAYAGIRDERQELSLREVEAKQKLLDLMHKHEKEEYNFDGIRNWIEHESETVKVRVKAKEEEDEDAA